VKSVKDILQNIKDKSQNNNNDKNNNIKPVPLSKNLTKNLDYIKNVLGDSNDLIIREFILGDNYKCAIIIIDGLTKGSYIYDNLLKTLLVDIRATDLAPKIASPKDLFTFIKSRIISLIDIQDVDHFDKLFNGLLIGDSILLIDEVAKGYIIETKGWIDRGVTEATSQTVVRGPKDSFNETLRTNTMLIRRRVKDTDLRIENKTIGSRTKTDVSVIYIKGLANQKIVEEIHERLDRIDIDAILESSYIELLCNDNKYSPFPTMTNTERPDSAVASLLSGFIVILVDGTPYALIVPGLFTSLLQAAEDYYEHFIFATFIRFVRFFAIFLAMLTPSIYIAVTTFHQEMLPTPLLVSISNQREGIPFPGFVEALLMEFTFEILREAGIRMPRAIGTTISIVGALVLGEAAVQAGIVSSVMVIVVSITAISGLITPAYNLGITIRLLRFGFMILGASFGLYGITIGMMMLLLHLCSIRSFGVPYLYPFAPLNLEALKDSIFRFPLWAKNKRPNLISQGEQIRQQPVKKAAPNSPKPGEEINR